MARHKILLVTVSLAVLFSAVALTALCSYVSAMYGFPDPVPPSIQIGVGERVVSSENIQGYGNTYILTGDVNKTISIMRDGIVLDGRGHTLRGNHSGIGIWLQRISGVKIKNLTIESFEYGIKVIPGFTGFRGDITVSGVTFRGNHMGVAFLDWMDSTGSNISDNYFVGNTFAVYFPTNSILRGNRFDNNSNCLLDTDRINDVDDSNLVNDRQMIYWVNQKDKAVPSNAGWVMLKNCKNITVQDLTLNRHGDRLALYETSDSTIKNNVIGDANDLRLDFWSDLRLDICNSNLITQNNISRYRTGVYVWNSNNTVISKNQICDNQIGVKIEMYCFNTIVCQNNIYGSSEQSISINKPDQSTLIDGNYWGDYVTRYPSASEVGKTGIGDTSYYINEYNSDMHPLMRPTDAGNIRLSPDQETLPLDTKSILQNSSVLLAAAIATTFGVGVAMLFWKHKH